MCNGISSSGFFHGVKTESFCITEHTAYTMEHPNVDPVYRTQVTESVKQPRITRPYYTKYEYTALIAMRAQQIAEGAKPLVALDGLKSSDPMFVWNVAKREVEQQKLPFIVRRLMPDGTSEFWSVSELETNW